MKNQIYTIFLLLFFIFSPVYSLSPGKMIITGFKGVSPDDPRIIQLKRTIDEKKIGGVILFKRNIKNKVQLKQLIQYLTKNTPIFVVIDHEGGLVNRLTHPSFQLKTPSPELFCKLEKDKQQFHAKQISTTLKDIGINVNLGGVVDIAPLIYSSSICRYKRCFSDSQDEISSCTSILFSAHKDHHIFFALKHFPGHGSTPVDSHYQLPDITKTHSEYDYMPYHTIMKSSSNYDMVMIGHLMDTRVDNKYPASLSKRHIKTLRSDLNYDGFIITDDLNMGALYRISRNKATLAGIAAEAGNHLLLFEYLDFSDIDQVINHLSKIAKQKPTLKKHILDSSKRINMALSLNDS